ncbi:MAG TPA: TauD/TfdA family dioxygenase [Xanthobacteraceae bacterium]|nr:TauD/TfdA family dioxygenase [Xanthobacteraceae bacterium]
MIDIIPLSKHVGAEVRGLDLAREIEPAAAAELYAAWLKHHVLVFRGQKLSADDQRRFTMMFGEIQPPRSRPGQRDPNNPVLYIGNATIDGQRGELPEGDMQFHADQCYYENPAKGAVLYALEIPSRGGNTLFASTLAAFESLPHDLREQALRLQVLFLYDYEKNANHKAPTNWSGAPRHIHPAVVLHPEIRRPTLLVNRLMADSVVGMSRERSDKLLELLCQAAERPEHIYEHEWRVGDLLIWDNRATLHARTDFDPSERRVLRRLAIRGERPIPAIPLEELAS